MRIDPPIQDAARYPVTLLTAMAAIGVSLLWWTGRDVGWAMPPTGAAWREPWRLLVSVLPHVNVVHLLFNTLWLWELGARIERRFGPVRYLLLIIALAAASGAAESATGAGGVGLSGVVYGFFGLMYVMRSRDEWFAAIMTQQTVQTFVVWFFVCIGLTVAHIMSIGNVAHGTGALVGYLIGRACLAPGAARPRWAALTVAATAAVCVGAWFAAPWLGHPAAAGQRLAVEGRRALERGDPAAAIEKLEAADRAGSADGATLMTLGIAYQRVNRQDDALATYRRALQVEPGRRSELAPAMASLLGRKAAEAVRAQALDEAEKHLREALTFNRDDDNAWTMLGWVHETRGEQREALQAYHNALSVKPDNPTAKQGVERIESEPTNGK